MSFFTFSKNASPIIMLSLGLVSCFHPPFNNFEKRKPDIQPLVMQASVGAVAGVASGGTATAAIIGAAVGTGTASALSIYRNSESATIKALQSQDIQFIRYGDTRVLVVPTDHYFVFNSAQLNDICYAGLNNIVHLLQFYPKSTIYVAAFTDNVGNRSHKRRLSQAQAESMLGFLWANGISSARLKGEGFADRHTIGDNEFIHGSALNRRIEIEWVNEKPPKPSLSGFMK